MTPANTSDRDYASKDWLRTEREPFTVRALHFVFRVALLAAIALAFAWIISQNEARAGLAVACKRGDWRVILPDSYRPASLDDCQAAFQTMPRAAYTASFQSGTGRLWTSRTCGWR